MKLKKYPILAGAAALTVALFAPSVGHAQFGAFRNDFLKTNKRFQKAFRPIVTKVKASTALVLDGKKKRVALGTVVDAGGLVITKASKLTDTTFVRIGEQTLDAEVVGRNDKHDLALLRVDANDLKPVRWLSSKKAKIGSWAVSVGASDAPVALGVVSVATRKVPTRKFPLFRNKAFLGVSFAPDADSATIAQVVPRTAAQRAGIRAKDVIIGINNAMIKSPTMVSKTLMKYKIGDTVNIRLRRGERELTVRATLAKRPRSRGDVQNNMGSKLSARRDGFPIILQHDGIVPPDQCGGPVVDLDGRVIGINVARAGRTESYAIPSEVVQQLIRDLQKGD